MDVTVAKTAGFCFGVKRAMDIVEEQILLAKKETERLPIYTFGPIIHNEEVVKNLDARGVKIMDDGQETLEQGKGTVIIRSHGVSKAIYEELERKGYKIVDATCPFVKKIHKTVNEQSEQGRQIIIIGNRNHPEVQGIRGWCPDSAICIETPEEAEAISLPPETKICIVSQTTFNYKKFQVLVEIIEKIGYDCIVANTVCSATHERQSEARSLASQMDVMLVVGGKNSSNTQKLYEICRKECSSTYFIQTSEELCDSWFEEADHVGITAGASTPNYIIEEVQNYGRRCSKL